MKKRKNGKMRKNMRQSMKTFGCLLMALIVTLTGVHIQAISTVTVARAASPVVERAISWAISIANDNSHGYSQSSRWGPDYDCSSFVISAFRNAGVNVGTATYTGNMRAQFTQHGFQWIPWSQIGGTSNLQRGDILLNEVQHTEIYLGGNQNVGAHSNRGRPQTGDQTGTEVSVSGYYYHPWNGVLRYVGSDVCTCSADYAGEYCVTTNSLPLTMRSGHGTGYSVVASIPKGSKVYVSRADGNWAHVEWNGHSGYCSMSYLSRITSKSYNLHVWVSDTEMGSVPSKFVVGKRYYICYELMDESTGKKANETSSINYRATETVRNSKGRVFDHTYENSDYNWISIVCDSEDTYTGTVTISGDVEVSCSISFDAYADVSPQYKIWTWEGDDSNEIDTIGVGQTAYCSYLIRDKYTEKKLNDVTTFCTNGDGYTVTIHVYDPDGTRIKTQTYKNNDCTWFKFVPDKMGNYKIKASVAGTMNGTYERTLKVVEKEHKYPSSWTVTRKADCTQTGIKTRICSICGKTETQTIAKKSHTYDNGTVTKSATCNNAGEKTYTCTVCGATKNETIPATGHTVVKDRNQTDENGDDMDSTHTVEEKAEESQSPVRDEVTEEQNTSEQNTTEQNEVPAMEEEQSEGEIAIPLPTDSVGKIVNEVVKKIKNASLKRKTVKLSLRWRRVKGAKGYQLQYSLKKNLYGRKRRTVKRNRVMLKGLKAKRNYYIRIRPYTYTGSGEKQYGNWSKVMRFRTK